MAATAAHNAGIARSGPIGLVSAVDRFMDAGMDRNSSAAESARGSLGHWPEKTIGMGGGKVTETPAVFSEVSRAMAQPFVLGHDSSPVVTPLVAGSEATKGKTIQSIWRHGVGLAAEDCTPISANPVLGNAGTASSQKGVPSIDIGSGASVTPGLSVSGAPIDNNNNNNNNNNTFLSFGSAPMTTTPTSNSRGIGGRRRHGGSEHTRSTAKRWSWGDGSSSKAIAALDLSVSDHPSLARGLAASSATPLGTGLQVGRQSLGASQGIDHGFSGLSSSHSNAFDAASVTKSHQGVSTTTVSAVSERGSRRQGGSVHHPPRGIREASASVRDDLSISLPGSRDHYAHNAPSTTLNHTAHNTSITISSLVSPPMAVRSHGSYAAMHPLALQASAILAEALPPKRAAIAPAGSLAAGTWLGSTTNVDHSHAHHHPMQSYGPTEGRLTPSYPAVVKVTSPEGEELGRLESSASYNRERPGSAVGPVYSRGSPAPLHADSARVRPTLVLDDSTSPASARASIV